MLLYRIIPSRFWVMHNWGVMMEEPLPFSDMEEFGGFAYNDYDVMERSCNTFTAALAKNLGFEDRYPASILQQSKIGEFFAPVVHALDIVAETSGSGDQECEFAASSLRVKNKKDMRRWCDIVVVLVQRGSRVMAKRSLFIDLFRSHSSASIFGNKNHQTQKRSFFKKILAPLRSTKPEVTADETGNAGVKKKLTSIPSIDEDMV